MVPKAGAGTNAATGSETVAQRLKRVTSLNFARDTLENAVRLLAEDIGVKYEILGPDLQLEGITKNQSFGLDEKNKPAGEILRNIMLKANPDGKLVYVVKPQAAGWGRGAADYDTSGRRKARRHAAAGIGRGTGEEVMGQLRHAVASDWHADSAREQA